MGRVQNFINAIKMDINVVFKENKQMVGRKEQINKICLSKEVNRKNNNEKENNKKEANQFSVLALRN